MAVAAVQFFLAVCCLLVRLGTQIEGDGSFLRIPSDNLPSSAELPCSDDTPVDNEEQNFIPNFLLFLLEYLWGNRQDWFDEDGNRYISTEEAEQQARSQLLEMRQELDIAQQQVEQERQQREQLQQQVEQERQLRELAQQQAERERQLREQLQQELQRYRQQLGDLPEP